MMKKLNSLTLLLLLYSIAVYGQEKQDVFKITHGPYLCDMSETGVTVVWTTNRKAMAWVEVAPDDATNFYSYERPKHYDTKYGRIQANTTLHVVRINDLKPGTSYRYAIFSKEMKEWPSDARIEYGTTIANPAYARNSLRFKTFSQEDDTVSFLVFNDLHGRAQFMKDILKNTDLKKIDFVVFNGDMSSTINSEEQIFTDFIDPAVEMFATRIPIMYTRGNHETRGTHADELMKYFPKKNPNIYEQLNVGKVAMLLLDCGEDKPDSDIEYSGIADFDAYRTEQAAWVKDAVTTEQFRNAAARIAILHMPPLVSNWHGNIHLSETLLPILNKARVTVMFSGHTHRYSLNPPVKDVIEFPVLVNSNNGIIKCDVINGRVITKIITLEGKPVDNIF